MAEETTPVLAEVVASILEAHGWTAEEMGARVGLSASAISMAKQGKRGLNRERIEAYRYHLTAGEHDDLVRAAEAYRKVSGTVPLDVQFTAIADRLDRLEQSIGRLIDAVGQAVELLNETRRLDRDV